MQSLHKSTRIAAERLIIVGFLLTLALPTMGYIAGQLPFRAQAENVAGELGEKPDRPPSLRPTPRSFAAFPNDLRFHFQKHFGFRKELIRAHGVLKVQLLGVSSTPQVVVGKRGWHYYADEEAIDSYRCLKPFTSAELEHWRDALEARRSWLATRGIPYLFVLVPDKHTIYPEYLPSTIKRAGHVGRLDQLTEYLSAHSRVRVLDLRPALFAAKESGRLYHKADTHWNERGAYVGYSEIMNQIAVMHPSAAPRPLSDFEERSTRSPGGDLARFLGLQDVLNEDMLGLKPREPRQARRTSTGLEGSRVKDLGYEPLIITVRPGAPIRRAVLFRDSFTSQMMPFLSEHFSRAVYVWSDGFDPAVVLRERPDVVIQQLVERKLMRLEPSPWPESLP